MDPNKGENGFLHNEVGYGQFYKVDEIKKWYKVATPTLFNETLLEKESRWCGEKSKNIWCWYGNFYFIDKEDAIHFKLVWG